MENTTPKQKTLHTTSSRKHRPQRFDQVLGQETSVQTLKNAIRMGRIAHAYLFCGTRGTGKTTLARVFAKALNCPNLDKQSIEPCNACSTCREIALGSSLDVLEIDGASNRGIDDIRQLSESIGYTPINGPYKIFLIDEVHMLTKEAFNALLKNLEEPPPSAKFFFATTEPHKIPETIISRCQRFNLRRLQQETIVQKLQTIAKDNSLLVEPEVLHTLAQYAEGGLRDAESLFDQLFAFAANETITKSVIEEVLGLAPQAWFEELNEAIVHGISRVAFDLANKLFVESKDIGRFLEDLAAHFRKVYLIKIGAQSVSDIPSSFKTLLTCLQEEQIQRIFHFIYDAMKSLKAVSSQRFLLEKLLLDIISARYEIPLPYIVKRLSQLEDSQSSSLVTNIDNITSTKEQKTDEKRDPIHVLKKDLPFTEKAHETVSKSSQKPSEKKETSVVQPRPAPFKTEDEEQEKRRQESLMHFAAVELEGSLQKKK